MCIQPCIEPSCMYRCTLASSTASMLVAAGGVLRFKKRRAVPMFCTEVGSLRKHFSSVEHLQPAATQLLSSSVATPHCHTSLHPFCNPDLRCCTGAEIPTSCWCAQTARVSSKLLLSRTSLALQSCIKERRAQRCTPALLRHCTGIFCSTLLALDN